MNLGASTKARVSGQTDVHMQPQHLTLLEALFHNGQLSTLCTFIYFMYVPSQMFKCLAQYFRGARSCAGLSFLDNKGSGKVG